MYLYVSDSLPVRIHFDSEEKEEGYVKNHWGVYVCVCGFEYLVFIMWCSTSLCGRILDIIQQQIPLNNVSLFLEILTFCFFLFMCPGMEEPSLMLYKFCKNPLQAFLGQGVI